MEFFVGKGYACNGMYKMSVNEITSSAYLCCSTSLWHFRLGHISKKNLKRMTVMGMIKIQNEDFEKYEICAKSKIMRKPFPSVSRETELLELVHTDICEVNGLLTRCGRRYFITFIDDCCRYCYVYLLRSKN